MADEPNLDANTQTVDVTPVAAPTAAKKRRSPAKRKETNAPVAVTPSRVASVAVQSKARRHSESEKLEKITQIENSLSGGSTLKAAAKEAGISDQTFYQWKRSVPSSDAKVAQPAPQDDSLVDLLKLEAENLRLRNLLAEKLRAENAELRKRLGMK
ncbi:transposase [Sinorhizobium sp. RAC02]|uniref:transposase n=1 Tax=Sinorhizobium sp. RAC02 TaxID=1842534 RepID=UPI00083D2BB8|nr:transposase [Sinorhizobium sp. RAC02]AOF92608.1 transposase family protein [Sinorhizobium sp. RAC02]